MVVTGGRRPPNWPPADRGMYRPGRGREKGFIHRNQYIIAKVHKNPAKCGRTRLGRGRPGLFRSAAAKLGPAALYLAAARASSWVND